MSTRLKKIISALLTTAMLFSFFNFSVVSADEEISLHSEAEDFTWMVSNGTLTITGNGDMPQFWSGAPWSGCGETIKKVVICEGITSISDSAFASYGGKYEDDYGAAGTVEEVVLPQSLERIEAYAFSGCKNLKTITIPEYVEYMGDCAFIDCTSLTDVSVLGTLDHIASSTFNGCTSLKTVTLSEHVKSIGGRAFYLCENLEKVIIGSDDIYIDYEAFEHSTLLKTAGGLGSGCDVEYGWETKVKSANLRAFSNVTTLEIPEGVEVICEGAFSGASKLSSVSLPSTLKGLEARCFSGCARLQEIDFPEGLVSIGDEAFANTYYEDGSGKGESGGFYGLKSVNIPESVTAIGYGAFSNCRDLTSVVIPENVEYLGDCAFLDCTSLTDVSVLGKLGHIGSSTFNGCTSLKTVTLSEYVKSIGGRAFYLCENLEKVIIGSDNIYIDYEAFEHSTLLKTAGGLGSGCDVEYGWGKEISESGLHAFPEITTLEIPEGVEVINGAFVNCQKLKYVTLPGTLKEIGHSAFANCPSLGDLEVPYGVTKIGDYAFTIWGAEDGGNGDEGGKGLQSIFIPSTVTEIGYDAFYGCSELVILCEPGSYAEEYALEKGISVDFAVSDVMVISIEDNEGNALPGEFSVNWYEKGSDEIVATGKMFSGYKQDTEYEYEIIFGEELSLGYYQPQKQSVVTTSGRIEIPVKPEKIGNVTISGKVMDENENPIDNASVNFEQIFNGKYKKTITVKTNNNGEFSKEVPNVATTAKISAKGYFSKAKRAVDTKSESEEIALGSTIMEALPSNKITLSIKKTGVKTSQAEPSVSEITSADGINFIITNETRGIEVTDFEIQFPELVIGDDFVSGGDVIKISAYDKNNKMTAESAVVTLDPDKNGSALIGFVENGYLSVSGITGSTSNYAMIFDESGKFVESYITSEAFSSDNLESGNYTLLLIKKTNLLRGVNDLSKFNALGLEKNIDYVTESFCINPGEITKLKNIYVPAFDESKLYYTIEGNTKFVANVSSAVAGKYIILRAEYEIDPRYSSSDEVVTIELPENINFTDGSLTLDSELVPYGVDGQTITVNTNARKGVVRFYVVATQKGSYNINAYLGFDKEGTDVLQPIGTASFDVEASKIILSQKVSRKNISVTGTALPDSLVTLYNNNKQVGSLTANKNGSWSLEFDLEKPYTYSYHNIYATVKKQGYDLMTTDDEFLVYDENLIEVSKVTMINHKGDSESSTVIDFIDPKPVKSYTYYPDCPVFTFKVEFLNGGNDKTLSDVYVVTKGVNEEIVRTPVIYDEVTDSWLGSTEFTSSNTPKELSVEFTPRIDEDREFVVDADMIKDLAAEEPELSESDKEILQSYFETELVEENINADGTGNVVTKLNSENGNMILTYSSEKIDGFVNDGSYEETKLSDGTIYYIKSETAEEYIIKEMYDSSNKTLVSVKIEPDTSLMSDEVQMLGFSSDLAALMSQIQYMTRWFSGSLQAASKNADNLWNEFQQAKANNHCFDKSPNAAYIEDTAQREYSQIKEEISSSLGQFLSIVETVSSFSFLMPDVAKSFIGGILAKLASLGSLASLHGKMLNLAWMAERAASAGKPCGPPPGPGSGGVPGQGYKIPVSIDPSGYVYEAVPSNRVEGVKAECYYYDYPVDEFGVQKENKEDILWDASEYDQINPIYTDKNGMYAWDVPPGEWLVKFSKEGYYDTDSKLDAAANANGYLPVPPPQTEVNTAIVSKAAPEVESVNVYKEEVQIIFSQYMQPDTVNTQNVKVICGGGEVAGTILPVNAEFDYKGENEYASIFKFVPDTALEGNVEVEIDDVVNYAGKEIYSKCSNIQMPQTKPEGISIAANVSVPYNSGALVEIEILPKGAGANKTLEVTTSSPSIVGVVNNIVTTDENGKATVMLSGNMPGEGNIQISLAGTDVKTSAKASVGSVTSSKNVCGKVTSNIKSGSVVEKGTKVTLSTKTQGAEIYYTLDGTCPCIETNPARIKYTGEITVDENMFIIAYAVKDGMEDSATAGFVYSVLSSETTVTKVDNLYVATIDASINMGDVKIYIAGYSETGKMICIGQADMESGKVTFDYDSDIKYFKTFIWGNNIKPLVAAEIDEI